MILQGSFVNELNKQKNVMELSNWIYYDENIDDQSEDDLGSFNVN